MFCYLRYCTAILLMFMIIAVACYRCTYHFQSRSQSHLQLQQSKLCVSNITTTAKKNKDILACTSITAGEGMTAR